MKRYEYVSINSDLLGLSGFEGRRVIIDADAPRDDEDRYWSDDDGEVI